MILADDSSFWDLWDFTDPTFLAIFIVTIVFIILIVVFAVTFSIMGKNRRAFRRDMLRESNTSRIFVIDTNTNLVTYFNKTNLKDKRTMDMVTFYKRFDPSDVERVKNWIFAICNPNETFDEYLQADIIIEHGRSSYFSLLKFLHYDESKGLLHLESHILKYITPVHSASRSLQEGKNGIISRDVVSKQINESKNTKGFTFSIRLFFLKQNILASNQEERFMAMTLMNEIFPFVVGSHHTRYILTNGEMESYLFDFSLSSKDEALRLATSISKALNKAIQVNGFANGITFAIGVIENSAYYQNFDSLVREASTTAMRAHQDNKNVQMYQGVTNLYNVAKYEEEINELLRGNSFRYFYRPIINVKRKQTYGYFSYVRVYDTSFNSFEELSQYASDIGKNRELLAKVSRNIITKFASEAPESNSRLFYYLSMGDLNNALEIFLQIPKVKDIRLILLLNEDEVMANSLNIDALNQKLKEVKSHDFEIALALKSEELLLDPSIYANFDYFVVGDTLVSEMKKDSRTRLSIHNLLEQLLRFKRPIIVSDLEGWVSIELIIKSGIDLISSEVVSYSSDMILPVEKKKLDKLSQMVIGKRNDR
ncbi:MAG: hypothetical protein LUD22_02305 [Coprobacillus sp.]|nr:hypothetical protein [Coprobacillus sp.]